MDQRPDYRQPAFRDHSGSAPPEVRFEEAPARHLGSIRAVVTERSGGSSPPPYESLNLGRSTMDVKENVQANERRVLESLRLVDRVARLRLEHGRRILAVDSPGLFGPADALVTTQPDLVLWLTVADCYPLVLASGDALLLGHCGWRGVAAGLVEAMVEKLLETSRATGKSSRGSPARAWIGPGIGRCCYPVGAEVAERFPRSSTPMSDPGAGRSGGRVHLDLAREIALRLLACGLPATAIAASGACTSCQVRRFFSHRRDGAPTGRMAALCWRNPPAPEK